MPETRRSNSARRASKEYPPSMFDGSSTMRPQTCRSWALVSKYRKLASSPPKRCMSRVYVRHFGHRAPSSPSHDLDEDPRDHDEGDQQNQRERHAGPGHHRTSFPVPADRGATSLRNPRTSSSANLSVPTATSTNSGIPITIMMKTCRAKGRVTSHSSILSQKPRRPVIARPRPG